MPNISNLVRSLANDGRFTLADAQKVMDTAKTPEEVAEVKKLMRDPGLAPLLAGDVQRRLANFVATSGVGGTGLGALPNGGQIFLKDGVFVSAPDAALPTTPQAYGESLYGAARIFSEPGQNPTAHMNQAEMRSVLERIKVGLTQCRAGQANPDYTDTQAAQQRSASATVLREMMAALKNSDGQGRLLQAEILQTLVGLAKEEKNPGLRDHMAFHLHALKETVQTDEQKATINGVFDAFAPLYPPYDQWFANGNRQLNVVCHTGSEFYKSEVETWLSEGYIKKEESPGQVVLEKKEKNPEGEEITIRLKMVKGARGTFDDMDDENTHIVAYSGHSGWGKNMPRELKNAPDANGPKKLMVINQCCGQGIINKVRDKYPNSELMTTRYSSYESEDHFALNTLLNGVVDKSCWESIHYNIAGEPWHNERNNYITPADEFTRIKTRDRDHDGKADILDRLYDFNTFDVQKDTDEAFQPQPASRRNEVLSGERVHTSSQIVNTTLGFSEYLDHMSRENAFIGGGFFEPQVGSPDSKKMVRLVEREISMSEMSLNTDKGNVEGDKQTLIEVQLNKDYAHASEETVKAATFMETAMKYGNGKTKAERALQGLMLIAHSVDIDVEYGRERMIFDNLVKHYGLPEDLSYHDAKRYLKADSHVYAGSEKGLEQWAEALGAEKMKEIETALQATSIS